MVASMKEYIDPLEGFIAPLIFYSDVTSLSNNGKMIDYPLMLFLVLQP
jgi:hypothetical protein